MTPGPSPTTPWQGLSFSLGGIPVLIRPAFLLIAVLFGSQAGTPASVAVWVGVLFFSILVHELGHALAMRAFGFSPTIEIHAMGGLTAWSPEKRPTPGQRVRVTLCGPAAGLALGGIVYVLQWKLGADVPALVRQAFGMALWVNLSWSLVNLLPVLPWDGGLILDSTVELIAKKPKPKIAAVSSVVVGSAVILVGLVFREYLMLVYIGGLGVWQGYLRLAPKKPADDTFNQVWSLMQAQKFAEAERLAVEKAVRTADVGERAQLYEAVAWSRLLREDWRGADMAIDKMGTIRASRHLRATLAAHLGRNEEVLEVLTPLPTAPPELALRSDALIALKRYEQVVTDACDLLSRPDPTQRRQARLLAAKLFEAQAWEPSMQVSLTAFETLREPVHLQKAACAQVKLGKLDDALSLLDRAFDAGLTQRKELAGDPDLAPLHALPQWQTLLARMT